MFKRISLFFVGMVSVSAHSPVHTRNTLGKLQSLNSQIDPHALQPMILNLQNLENNLYGEIQNLADPMTIIAGIKVGTEAADAVMTTVERGTKLIGDAVEWGDKVTTEAADVERIRGVLDFIRKEQVVLVQYAGKLLTQSISALSLAAYDISEALEDVHFMAREVKTRSERTKEYIEIQEQLSGGKILTEISQDQLDLWELTLVTLLDNLERTYARTTEIRQKL